MRLLNLVVLCIILCGIAMSGSCLWAVHQQFVEISDVTCELLGPGIIVASIGIFASLFAFMVGVVIRMQDGSFQLLKSLYALNFGIASALVLGLLV